MMKEIVTKAWKNHRGIVVHQIVDEKGVGKPVRNYTKIYGGLSWPSADSPGYHCILGEEFAGTTREGEVIRGKVRLLAESESDGISLDEFFNKVTDDAVKLLCDTVFAEMDEQRYSDFTKAYQDYLYDHSVHSGRMQQASFEKDFVVGMGMIKDWLKNGLLEIPTDSIVYWQLKSFARHDLKDSPETRFHAINALRFAVAGFNKYKPSLTRTRRRTRRRNAMVV